MTDQTQTPPLDQTQTPPVEAARPEYVPETFWDPAAKAVKPEFGKHYSDLATFHKTETERRAALPQKPEDVKIALPEDFKIPEGVPLKREDFKLDEKDPRLPILQALAVKHGWSQAQVNDLFALDAQMMIAEQMRLAAEDKKLGANAPVRKKAVGDYFDGLKAKGDLTADEHAAGAAYATDAAGVSFLEKLIAKAGGAIPANGGGPPTPPKPADIPIEQRWYGSQQKAS